MPRKKEDIQNWQRVGTPTVLAKGFGKSLLRQTYRRPDGKEEDYILFDQQPWSVILAITKAGEVIVTFEYKQGRDTVDAELPAGTAGSPTEDPRETARRELLEETGYQAKEMLALGTGYMATRGSSRKFYAYLALCCERVNEGTMDESEDIATELWSLFDWLSAVINGTITEPSAVVATMRALPFLRSRFGDEALDAALGSRPANPLL